MALCKIWAITTQVKIGSVTSKATLSHKVNCKGEIKPW